MISSFLLTESRLALSLCLIIVTVRSAVDETGCSVCGIGFEVTNPDAIFEFPGQPYLTCGEWKQMGEDGLIPLSDCPYLPPLLIGDCGCHQVQCNACGKEGYQTVNPSNVIEEGFVNSPIGFVQPPEHLIGTTCSRLESYAAHGLLDKDDCMLLPILTAAYCGGCTQIVFTAPTTPTASPSFPTTSDLVNHQTLTPSVQLEATPTTFDRILLIGSFLLLMLVILPTMYSCKNRENMRVTSEQRTSYRGLEHTVAIRSGGSTERNGRGRNASDKNVRSLVLAVLFSERIHLEATNNNLSISRNSAGNNVLKYDTLTKQYRADDDDDTSLDGQICSICLDRLDDEHGSIVAGLCSHIYHRDCILKWLQDRHDDCPNCRQPMWEQETYKLVEEFIISQDLLEEQLLAEIG